MSGFLQEEQEEDFPSPIPVQSETLIHQKSTSSPKDSIIIRPPTPFHGYSDSDSCNGDNFPGGLESPLKEFFETSNIGIILIGKIPYTITKGNLGLNLRAYHLQILSSQRNIHLMLT